MSETPARFECDHCGKRHTWKPQLAGKRAKCSCGMTITIPATPPQEDPDALYDIVDTPAPPPAYGSTPAMAPPVAAVTAAAPLSYQRGPTQQEIDCHRDASLISPWRDFIAPLIILILGFVGLIGWASYATGGSAGAMIGASVIWSITTLLKTAILIGLAFVYAPQLGVSFGDFRTAILKFAAIVLFTDAADLWLMEVLTYGRRGWISIRIIAISLAASFVLISILCQILFEMDWDETGMFAFPMAAVSQVLGFLMRIGVIALINAIFTPAPPAAPPPAGGGTVAITPGGAPPGAPAPPTSTAPSIFSPDDIPDIDLSPTAKVKITPTPADRAIQARLQQGGPTLRDALEWTKASTVTDKGETPDLVNDLLAAGATDVKLEIRGPRPEKLYATLPATRSARAASFKAARNYARRNQLPEDPQNTKELNQQYLAIDLKP